MIEGGNVYHSYKNSKEYTISFNYKMSLLTKSYLTLLPNAASKSQPGSL